MSEDDWDYGLDTNLKGAFSHDPRIPEANVKQRRR